MSAADNTVMRKIVENMRSRQFCVVLNGHTAAAIYVHVTALANFYREFKFSAEMIAQAEKMATEFRAAYLTSFEVMTQ